MRNLSFSMKNNKKKELAHELHKDNQKRGKEHNKTL
jgi:hypothetical protein